METARKIKVIVYEDNNCLRDSLEQLLLAYPDFECAGCYPNALHILDNLAGGKPDVILMDIDMPGISGIQAVLLAKKHYPSVRILMQTVFDDNENIFRSICAGADGYVLKKASPLDILEAIRDTFHGHSAISPSIAARVLSMFRQQAAPVKNESIDLGEREREILNLLTKGLSYKTIAAVCFISIDTVRFHIRNIYEKLHVHSKAEAVSKAINERLI